MRLDRLPQRLRVEPARGRDVAALEQDRSGRRQQAVQRLRGPGDAGGEAHVLEVPPRIEIRRRVDGAVVAEEEQRGRVHLEVEVVRAAGGVAGVPHEAEDVARVDVRTVPRQRRVGGQVRVVVLVPGLVLEPEPVAADRIRPDREDDAVGDREERRAERREDVVAVVPASRDVAPRRAEGVAVPRRAVDREHVPLRGDRVLERRRKGQDREEAEVVQHVRRRLRDGRGRGRRARWSR